MAWPKRVAEIQQRAFALLALVAADDLRLDLAGAMDRRAPAPLDRAASSSSMLASSQAKNAASQISPYLMTSASPARSSRGGSVARCGIGEHGDAAGERRR